MPYYIYEITDKPIRRLSKIADYASFREAGAEAKRLRATGTFAGTVKVVLAANELEAEDLLSQPREAQPLIGEDF